MFVTYMLDFTFRIMSLIYIKNSKGPSMDACGTPAKKGIHVECSPLATVRM